MASGQDGGRGLTAVIVTLCKIYLRDPGPTREAASMCLATLLTRPDTENMQLHSFLSWCVATLHGWTIKPDQDRNALSSEYFLMLGIMLSLSQIFKKGHRFKLLPFVGELLECSVQLASCETNQTSTRKLLTKLIQRIGMTFLPPRIALWRYQRGQRSLGGLALGGKRGVMSAGTDDPSYQLGTADSEGLDGLDSGGDLPPEMEEVMEYLLSALSDKDTVVRWSAAKGIGRITMRLSEEAANDIIDAVVDLFADSGADSHWHGGCLALAELSRRGLLLPEKLCGVMPLIEQALSFDVVKGQHSIGVHVRDAACYVCWAFSRAYSPAVMAPFIRPLTVALLKVTLFDREINCRRAASAAFQETVGRQGNTNVPHGIDIITIADYFSVGNRSHCYTALARRVVSLDTALCAPFMQHLASVKLRHWDAEVRVLAAKGLATLAGVDHARGLEYMALLIADVASTNLHRRHGALLGLAEAIVTLAGSGCSASPEFVSALLGTVQTVEKARLYRGRGGEMIRCAVCKLIECIAASNISVSTKLQVAYIESLNEHIRQPHESVQRAACCAMRWCFFRFFSKGADDSPPSDRLQKLTVLKFMDGLRTDANVAATRGYALALGALNQRLLVSPPGRLMEVLSCLESAGSPSSVVSGEHDADTCCNAVCSIMEIAGKLLGSRHFSIEYMSKVFGVVCSACADYSVDKRGDTGSWSRVAAMKGFERLVYASARFTADQTSSRRLLLLTPFGYCEPRSTHPLCTSMGLDKRHASGQTSSELVSATPLAGAATLCYADFPAESLARDALGALVGVGVEVESDLHCVTDSGVDARAFAVPFILSEEATYGLDPAPPSLLPSSSRPLAPVDGHHASAAADTGPVQSPVSAAPVHFDREQSLCLMQMLLKQLSEKLDAVREVAGGILVRLLEHTGALTSDGGENGSSPPPPSSCSCFFIPDRDVVAQALDEVCCKAFDAQNQTHIQPPPLGGDTSCAEHMKNGGGNSLKWSDLSWSNPHHVYPVVCRILRSELYFDAIIQGLALSVGGLSETTAKVSAESLLFILESTSTEDIEPVMDKLMRSILNLFAGSRGVDRVIVPALKMTQLLLREDALSRAKPLSLQSFADSLLQHLSAELRGCGNIAKICAIVELLSLCLVIRGCDVRGPTLIILLKILLHKYPVVRKRKEDHYTILFCLFLDPLTDTSVIANKLIRGILLLLPTN